MKPKSLALLLLFLFKNSYNCKAQRASTADTNLIILANKTAWKLRTTDLDSSKKIALNAINEAKKINYERGISYSFNILGYYYKVREKYDSAQFYYTKSLLIRKQLQDTLNIARSYRNLMSVYKLSGNIKQAISTGLMGLQLLVALPNNPDALKELALFKTNLCNLYIKTGDYSKAIALAVESQKYFKEQNDEEGLALVANCFGLIYEKRHQYAKALTYYKAEVFYHTKLENSRELGRAYCNLGDAYYHLSDNKTALSNYKKGIEILTENNFEEDIKEFLMNIGIIFEEFRKPDSAFFYYNRLLQISDKSGNNEGQYEAHRSIGLLLNSLNQSKKALPHLTIALKFSEKATDITETILLLKELSATYRALGNNDSAFFYTNSYSALSDSLNERLRRSVVLESELADKEHALDMIHEKSRRQQVIIIFISFVLFLMIIIFWMYSRSVNFKKREFKLKEIIKEKELMAMDAMLEGQEEERKRLGVELHDTIGSTLSAAKYAFKAMENSLEKLLDENKVQYQKINYMLDHAMDSVRKISHNMASGILTDKGLEGALEELCEMFQQSGKIKITLQVVGFDRKINYLTEINLYRIIQELLTNIIKHSQASVVNIQLLKSLDTINLIIEDNGIGFNPSHPQLKKGIGLLNIDNRVKKLSGQWNIDSGKGKGTTVIIDVPVIEETEL